jgi:hypothetical protein
MVLMDNTYKIDAKLDLSFKKSSTNPKYWQRICYVPVGDIFG